VYEAIRQGQVDLARLIDRIRHEFPALRFAEAALNDLGEDHAVVMLDDRWVFRFPRTAQAAALGAMERRLLARLNHASPVATPRYEHVSSVGDFGGYRMIAGRELTEAVFAALPRQAQERVLTEIGGFLRVLHALPPVLVARPGVGPPTEAAAWFVDRHAERRSRLAEALRPVLLDAADRFYLALPAAVASDHATVIHGDFSEDHMLLDPIEARLAGVIDFTDARFGDAAYDFAFLWAYGRWAPEWVARSYGGGTETTGVLARSLWWFTRFRVDQIWWSVSGARSYDVARIRLELEGLFATLGC
jgi:aminoglycoside 2''-phosphotransferase